MKARFFVAAAMLAALTACVTTGSEEQEDFTVSNYGREATIGQEAKDRVFFAFDKVF